MTNTTSTPPIRPRKRMSREELEWARTVIAVWVDILDGKPLPEAWHGKRPESTRGVKWTR